VEVSENLNQSLNGRSCPQDFVNYIAGGLKEQGGFAVSLMGQSSTRERIPACWIVFPEEPPVTESHLDSTARAERHERSRMIRDVVIFMSVAVCLLIAVFAVIQSLKGDEQPLVSMACAGKLYSSYDPKNFDQCVGVCMACNAGVRTTCSTSCRLRGAR